MQRVARETSGSLSGLGVWPFKARLLAQPSLPTKEVWMFLLPHRVTLIYFNSPSFKRIGQAPPSSQYLYSPLGHGKACCGGEFYTLSPAQQLLPPSRVTRRQTLKESVAPLQSQPNLGECGRLSSVRASGKELPGG